MNIVALQTDIAWEDKPANFENVRRLLVAAAPEADSLVILPEMFATGFSMNMESVAETYGGATEQFLAEMARRFHVCIVAGAAMRAKDGRVRNKALVFSPAGQLLAFYSKMRLFTVGGEAAQCVPGDRTTVFEWHGCRISPVVCYDLRFPELFRRAAAERRPELFVVIANWPSKRLPHWLKLLPARAIENQSFVVGVNRVGSDPYYQYGGRTLLVDAQGEVVADAGEQQGFIRARLDLEGLAAYRKGLPFLNDLVL